MRRPEKKDYLIFLSVILFLFLIIPVAIIKDIFYQYFRFVDKWVEKPMHVVRRSIVSRIDSGKTSDEGDREVPQFLVVELVIKTNAKEVLIAGDFTKWKMKEMERKSQDSWSFTTPLIKGVYRYVFIVDGKEILDPSNPNFDFYDNRKVSVLKVE